MTTPDPLLHATTHLLRLCGPVHAICRRDDMSPRARPHLTGAQLHTSLHAAAALIRQGPLLRAGLHVEVHHSHQVIWHPARNTHRRATRCPAYWTCQLPITVRAPLDADTLAVIAAVAGTYIGIGDHRQWHTHFDAYLLAAPRRRTTP